MPIRPYSTVLWLLVLILSAPVYSQETRPPVPDWQRSFGGTSGPTIRIGSEYLWALETTPDGGVLLGGLSESVPSGSKTNVYYGQADGWIVRLDTSGNEIWQRSFGGTDYDYVSCIRKTGDGGFVLAGFSSSPPSGNKTSAHYGSQDYWIIKIDEAGNKLWDRSYGGINGDVLWALELTSDGGFLIGGTSSSPTNSIKNSTWYGDSDMWIVRLNANGEYLWDRSFGGNNDDRLHAIKATPDGGFVLGGTTGSPASGNKTSGLFGFHDYWVVKVDSNGEKMWEQNFGGPAYDRVLDLELTPDSGILVGGESSSRGQDQYGNKSSPSYGGNDFWLVRLDADGNKLWDRSYGGTDNDSLRDIQRTADGGFLLMGESFSSPSGSKTSPNFGSADAWVIRLDADANQLWDFSLGSADSDGVPRTHEPAGRIMEASDGGYLVATHSRGGVTGNKRVGTYGWSDFWVVKLSLDLPLMGFGPGGFTNAVPLHTQAPAHEFKVWNAAYSTLTYTASTDVAWLTIEPATGSSANQTNSHVIHYDSSSLAVGTYNATITLGTNEKYPVPRSIAIRLSIFANYIPPRMRIAREGLRVFLSGDSGSSTYVSELSPDLRSWIPFSTNSISNTEIELFPQYPTNAPQMIFRARVKE